MSFIGNDGAKQDNDSSTKGSGNNTPTSKGFTISNASTTICINSPPTITIAFFTCYGTIIGKVQISGLGLGKLEGVGAGRQGSVAQGMLPDTRGRRQE